MQDQWVRWAVEIQSLAQAGLAYGRDEYDRERYARLREIAAEMIACKADLPLEKARGLFCGETGYQTPKIDTRAAVFEGDRILLVHEKNGTWALPGGWCDVDRAVGENAVKETLEEAGLTVTAERLIAVQDCKRHNYPESVYGIAKVFFLCRRVGGGFAPNLETTESGYFALDELPESLATEKTTREQIEMCFRAKADPAWQAVFD